MVSKNDYCKKYSFLKEDFTIFIIGGKEIYDQYIHLCNTLWVTYIKRNYLCDLFFNYDYSEKYTEKIIRDCDEFRIIKYEKI